MKHESHRLSLLRDAVRDWLALAGVNRSTIALGFVEAIERTGFTELEFSGHADLSDRARAVAQKLFRWLGDDQHTGVSLGRLFQVEAVLVEAMPDEIRLPYLKKVYPSVSVGRLVLVGRGERSLERASRDLMREQHESQMALVDYMAEPQSEKLAVVRRVLVGANAAGRNVLSLVDAMQPVRFSFGEVARADRWIDSLVMRVFGWVLQFRMLFTRGVDTW